jgi:hypothetical protein
MLRSQYDPMVDSASDRNDNQGYLLVGERGRCIGPTTLPPSCADRLEILGSHTLGATRTLEAVISTNVGEKLLLDVWCVFTRVCVLLYFLLTRCFK